MSGTVQRAAETEMSKRYEALFRVSQTLISIRSSEELFSVLARELREVVNFYVMGVGIYDEKVHEMNTTSYGEPGVPLQAPRFAPEETFSWWVYQHQQPLIIPSLEAETRFPAVAEMLKNRGVRSVCALPLTTAHRRLGGLAVGSIEADAYSREEVSFLSLVANQVALAVDDALNFDALQHAKEELRAGEDSLRLIVDSIPGLVHSTTAEGKLEFVNRQLLDYFGKTLKLRVAGTIGHRPAKQQRLHDCILTHPRPSLGAIEDHRDVNGDRENSTSNGRRFPRFRLCAFVLDLLNLCPHPLLENGFQF